MDSQAVRDPDAGGLSDAEALARLRRDGPNRLPQAERRSLLRIAYGALTQPMFLLLLVTAGLYALLGDRVEALMLGSSVLVVGSLSIYQEQRAERALQALKDLSSPRCTVVRSGRALRIASPQLVVGDRLIVGEGDRLAADAELLQAHAMQVDESLLSGESLPVAKRLGATPAEARLQAGSLVVRGDGVARVVATGAATMLGHIGHSLAQLAPRPSRLQAELRRLVQRVAWLALLTCVLGAALFGWREGSWSAGLLVGLTLAMALIPEEFAVVWSVMLALGAWRLAKKQVLTRQPQAIETLGTTSVLCVDKTGTLTRNQMTLVAMHDGAREWPPTEAAAAPLWPAAVRASVPHGVEPMDRAIFAVEPAAAASIQAAWRAGPRQGVQDGRPYVAHWWQDPASGRHLVAVKGAVERVLALCDGPAGPLQRLSATAEAWSARGLRVLAVAQAELAEAPPDGGLPPGLRLQPLGLLGFTDPLRDEVPAAIAACRQAGVRVVMITGDAPLTAGVIAAQAGLTTEAPPRVLTGAAVAELDDAALQHRVAEVDVYARVDPAQKLRIVQALQRRGEVVAMTGDGVNDAPALRAADIGVAMGRRGTDVAREAASLVLLDDNFASLVEAVRAGRHMFVNLHKALGYLFAVHVPIVGVSLLPVLMGGPVLLLPLHVVLLELIIDPACSLVFEAEPAPSDSMRVPPRRADARLFSLPATVRALALGSAVFVAVLAVQWLCRRGGASPEQLRLASLAAIVVGNLVMLRGFLGLRRRDDHHNPALVALLAGIVVGALLLLGVPGLAPLFGLPTLLTPVGLLAGLVLPLVGLGWRWAALRRTDGRRAAA